MTISMVAYLQKNSYLTEVVNEKIGIFHNAGLIDIWDRRTKNITQSSAIEESGALENITVSDLKAVFLIYLMLAGLSILTLIFEIIHKSLKGKINQFSMSLIKC